MRATAAARGILVAAALLVAPASAASAQDGTPVDRGMAAFKAGDYAAAVAEVEDVPPSDPLYAKARYVLAEAWLALGDGESAEKTFREVLEKKPDSVPAMVGVGRSLVARGKPRDALDLLRKAAQSDPKDASARRAVAECLAAQGKPVEARKELEHAAKIDPKDPLTTRLLVEILVTAGDVGAAGKAAETYQRANPKSALGDFLRGVVQERNGSLKEAEAAYGAAIEKDPKFLDAHKNLAILLVGDNSGFKDAEKTRRALGHFEKYFALGGRDKELRKIYDEIRAKVGVTEEKGNGAGK